MEPDKVAVDDYNTKWTYVACDDDSPCETCDYRTPHLDCIVVAVDGACKGNGTPGARAAVGVFVGKGSSYNKSVMLIEPAATKQIAELNAGILGLE